MDEVLKDAARLRYLAEQHWSDGENTLCVVRARDLRLGTRTYTGDYLREAIDKEMKNG